MNQPRVLSSMFTGRLKAQHLYRPLLEVFSIPQNVKNDNFLRKVNPIH